MRRRLFLAIASLLVPVAGVASEDAVVDFGERARQLDAAQRDAVAALGDRVVAPSDPVSGNPLGNVMMVVFTDPLCPFCRRFIPVVRELVGMDQALKVVWKDIPVLGPASQLQARALLAAQAQGGYDRMQEAMLSVSQPLDRDDLRAMAEAIGLDGNALVRDLDQPAIKGRLADNVGIARFLHIDGTPATVLDGRIVPGALHLDDLQDMVEEARQHVRP